MNYFNDPTEVTLITIKDMKIVQMCPELESFAEDIPTLIHIESRYTYLDVNITDLTCIDCTHKKGLIYIESKVNSSSGSDNFRSSKVHLTNLELSQNSKTDRLMQFINVYVYLHDG